MDNETPQGLMLHYRSKRRGFTTYTIGQLKAVAETYYKMEMAIEVKESEIKFDTVHVSFQVIMKEIGIRYVQCTSCTLHYIKITFLSYLDDF